jgi:hypothetical protein
MSRAPKRIWWCPIENICMRISPKKCNYRPESKNVHTRNYLCDKCTAKPYVPEKGGER